MNEPNANGKHEPRTDEDTRPIAVPRVVAYGKFKLYEDGRIHWDYTPYFGIPQYGEEARTILEPGATRNLRQSLHDAYIRVKGIWTNERGGAK